MLTTIYSNGVTLTYAVLYNFYRIFVDPDPISGSQQHQSQSNTARSLYQSASLICAALYIRREDGPNHKLSTQHCVPEEKTVLITS